MDIINVPDKFIPELDPSVPGATTRQRILYLASAFLIFCAWLLVC